MLYNRMAGRTTLVLDEETLRAARELAHRYDCTISEAIRRAVFPHRDSVVSVVGVRERDRAERMAALRRLFELFEGHDADAEIRRLKSEDAG